MGRERVVTVLGVTAVVGVAVGLGVALRDLTLGAWVLPGLVTVVLVVVGSELRDRGARERPEESQRDRLLAWSWHHPGWSALSSALVFGGVLSLLSALSYAPASRGYWRLMPAYLAAAAVGDLAGRLLPRRYGGDDPAIPERWRRRDPGTSPGMQADPRRQRP